MTSRRYPAKAFALIAVAVMLLSAIPIALIVVGGDDVSAEDGSKIVTYHDQSTGISVPVTYYGEAVAEYNPEYWKDSFVGEGNYDNWKGPKTTITKELTISWDAGNSALAGTTSIISIQLPDYTESWSVEDISGGQVNSSGSSNSIVEIDKNRSNGIFGTTDYSAGSAVIILTIGIYKVFGGWSDSNDNPINPGDVLNVDKVYVKWITPDLHIYGDLSDWSIHFNSWSGGGDYSDSIRTYHTIGKDNHTVWYQDGRDATSLYSTIYNVDSEQDAPSLTTGTYRSITGNGEIVVSYSSRGWWYHSTLSGDVILDNIRLVGSEDNPVSHGGEHALYAEDNPVSHGGEHALYANGNLLIIGTGVNTTTTSSGQGVQINGGAQNSDVAKTDVRIFSGTYSNVFGGCYNGDVGTSSDEDVGTSSVTILGGRVTDTVYGGCQSGDVNETRVLIVGGEVYDDSNPKYSLGSDGSYQTVVGASRNTGTVTESNVIVSNLGKVFAVQGGGRSASGTTTNETYVEISGKAIVYYMVCGSVTDGNTSTTHTPVGSSNVTISHMAVIGPDETVTGKDDTAGNVYAGGWDTYTNSTKASTERTNLNINGGTVYGSVYGGGFRGTIGSDETSEEPTVTIKMDGGTVMGSLFGGGRGGSDPIGIAMGDAKENSTGRAYILGDVSIEVNGGIVEHNVYGGGEGAARASPNDGGVDDSAMVDGDVTISIGESATVGGVFGGGMGDDSSSEIAQVTGNISIYIQGDVKSEENQGSNDVYGGGMYAAVTGNINVNISDATVQGSIYGGGMGSEKTVGLGGVTAAGTGISITTSGSTITGSIYGGGSLASTKASIIKIDISSTSVGSVYGSGRGIASNGDLGSVSASGEVTIGINSGSNVGEVYGGGAYGGLVANGLSITVDGSTVDGSVYGGGMGDSSSNTGSVTINESGSLTIAIVDGSDIGSLYGGGAFGKLESTGSADLSVSGVSTKIRGDVYGGGRNSAFSVDSMKLTIESSDIDGNVYGGGMYGLFESNVVDISLTGMETTIGGSVYGGGLGTEKKLATVVSERTIVINGPTILGSVYGGSRDGDDNYVDSGDGYGSCTTNIYILSGNISSGSSGNVYGGAYKGRSKMDSNIYVGSAVPEQIGYPVERTFSIHSIFGGASVGQVDDDYSTDTVLLFGNTSIRIGGEGYTGSITGNVFGEGDYCRISGSADIEFIGFSNPSDVSMLSIQKADSVTLVDTELVLDGDVDGNSTSGSAKLSINDVGMLTIVGHGSDARSGLTMNAQVSTLSGYESVHEAEFTDGDEYLVDDMNYLHLNGGKMFSVLGKNNNGTGMDTAVSGATVLIRDDNPYYGALAISGPSIDSTATFVLEDGTEAGMTVYNYGGVDVTVWYIAGAFTVDETVTLVSGIGNDAAIIGIPKMVSGSVIEYVGHYTSMNSEGSLNVVENLDGTTAGEDFQVMLGTKDGSIWYGWEKDGSIQYGLNLASAESGTQFQGTGATIGLSISTNSPFTMTGYAGTIHIHMVEVYGGITIGTFDIEVAVFLSIPQPDEDTYKINQDLLVKDYGDNKHEGTTEVYLPVLDGGAVGTYTLLSVSGIPVYDNEYGKLTMSLESTYLNKSGWLTRLWDGGYLENQNYGTALGEGGLFPPVLGFDFTCPGHSDPDSATEWSSITIKVQVVWTDGGVAKSQIYEIVLTPKHASERAVSFYDKWLSSDGTYTWQYLEDESGIRLPSFTLSVEFGDSLAGLYIAIKETDLKIAISNGNWSVEYYLSHFQEYLYCNDEGHAVTARSADEILEAAGTGYVAYPVYSYENSQTDLLDLYQVLKKSVIADTEEGYLSNIRWFDNPSGPAEFNFYSQVTDEGLSLYVGYGVILTFEAEVEGDRIGDDSIWVSPNTRFLEDLSREVDFKNLANSLRVTAGYKIIGFRDSQDKDITNQSMRILEDTTITVVLQAETYTLDITVKDEKGGLLFGDGVTSDAGIQIERSPEILHYGDKVSIMVKYTGDQQYRILGAEGEYGNFTLNKFTFTQAENNTYSVCEFQMPNGDLELTIILSEGYSLTVSIPESSPHTDDNHLFGLSKGADGGFTVSLDGAADEVILNLGLNAQASISFTMPSLYESNAVTISIGSVTGAHAVINGSSLVLTEISDDVSVELTIHVEWFLTVNGNGYAVSNDGSFIGSGETVHTGDVLTLTTLPGYSFDASPTVTGANITTFGSETVVMTVSGTGDVTITGDAVRHSVIVTVVIDFRNHESIPELVSIIGVATVSGSDAETGSVTNDGGRYSFTVEVLSGAQFSVTATIDGYIVSVYTGSSDEDVEVTIHAAERTTAEGPQEATGSLTISTVSDRVNDTYTVADVDGLGKGTFTFGDRTVTIGEGSVVLSDFDGFVGTMVLYSYEMGTLTIVSYPVTVGA